MGTKIARCGRAIKDINACGILVQSTSYEEGNHV